MGVLTASPSEKPPGRIEAIDGLRAVAVALVFLVHASPANFPGGFVGVDIFFVISGFVITRGLIWERSQTGEISLRKFYARRFFRIAPAMLAVLAFCAIGQRVGLLEVPDMDIVLALASVMNWARAFEWTGGHWLGHFWSLSVEEQFYLIWPLTLIVFGRFAVPEKRALFVLIGLVMLVRLALALNGASVQRISNGFDTRADELLIGCLLAFLQPRELGRLWPILVAGFIVVLFAAPKDSIGFAVFGYPIVAVLAGLTVAVAAWSRTPLNWWLELPAVQWAGSRSYAIYLWHYPLIGLCVNLDYRGAIQMGLALVLTLVAAELSYHLVESPFQRISKRRFGARAIGMAARI